MNSFQLDKSPLNQRKKLGAYDPPETINKERTDEVVRSKERALESFMVVSFLLLRSTTVTVFLCFSEMQLSLARRTGLERRLGAFC
jgi:hypothetical protein